MNSEEVRKIEEMFRSSESHDELFDAFQGAMRIKLTDLESYKILLANPVLSPDEIKMFAEKLLKEMPEDSFSLLMWTGKIFESHPDIYNRMEDAFNYYSRAALHQPDLSAPLLRLLNLYNYDIEFPLNGKIIDVIEKSIEAVERKSDLYYSLSSHYKKCGDKRREVAYLGLAEKAARKES